MLLKKQQTNTQNAMSLIGGMDKKKVVALSLIAIMILMWIRVFSNKKDAQAANTAILSRSAVMQMEPSGTPRVKVSYVELPQMEGRNDRLSRDMFSIANWDAFRGTKSSEPLRKIANESVSERIIRIGKELKLEAISSSKNPQAYISGVLASKGQKLIRKYEGENYEFEVAAINKSEVILRCKDVEVKLILEKSLETLH